MSESNCPPPGGVLTEPPTGFAEQETFLRATFRSTLWWLLVVAGAFAILFAGSRAFHGDLWFDETWRVSLIDSSGWFNPPAPLPPAWVWFMRLASAVFGTSAFAFRAVGAGVLVAALAVGARAVSSFVAPGWQRLAAAGAVALAIAAPRVAFLGSYVNNYTADVLFVAAVLLLISKLSQEPARGRSAVALGALLVLGPLFTVGGLFLLPVAGLRILTWSWRRGLRWWAFVGGTGALMAGSTAAVYITVWKPASSDALRGQWDVGTISSAGLHKALRRATEVQRFTLFNDRFLPFANDHVRLTNVLVALLGIVGMALLSRRNPWFAFTAVSAAAVAVGASTFLAWPLGPERVNLGWYWLLYAAAAFALLWPIGFVLHRLTHRIDPVGGLLVLAVFGLLAVTRADRSAVLTRAIFPIGVTPALKPIEGSSFERNRIIVYPPELRYLAHDRFENRRHKGHSYEVLPEVEHPEIGGPTAWRDIPPAAAGTAVWCVIVETQGDGASGEEAACASRKDAPLFFDEQFGHTKVIAWVAR